MPQPQHAADAFVTDAIVIGAGLAGLVAAAELVAAGKRVIILEQEPERASAGRPGGRSAGCSSSTPPSSDGWA
jgi:predicted oxidoreductase